MLVHLKTLGCRLNEAELETWAQAFQTAGHQITPTATAAQLVVINSCAVTSDAARKSRQLIRRVHRDNPHAKLVVSGCYATLNPVEAAEIMGVDMVVANQDKAQLVHKALTELNLDSMPAMSTEPGAVALFSRGRQRAFVKVQDGCRYRCTFCIVTIARGDEQSRPLQEVIDEINTLHAQGIQEVVLTGVHLGGYGADLACSLSDLISAVLTHTDIPRLRLGSLEPWELSPAFFELFANPRLMPHLHLPLQSGSDTVLRRMARRCKTEEFSAIVAQLRKQIPHFNVTTDIIVGFPGETEQEWQTSYDFVKAIGFGQLHIFSYSKREGTKAAELPDQVPEAVKKQRSQQLHQLGDRLKQDFFKQQLGQEVAVLWEGSEDAVEPPALRFGYTPNYCRIASNNKTPSTNSNQISNCRVVSTRENYLLTV
ncbi:MAG: tRNA (N(6)-L-threonylcarbamoyladenosine(37)-C(2))-methylthiotransferase MtaB [Methylococcaceae bacterium]|nr:tRNA (N(6)-L-threonylcarbamoyladenosine(37)-C(2))-methylthiotransferase MtaB [Methylococcaceae bacterium]